MHYDFLAEGERTLSNILPRGQRSKNGGVEPEHG